MKGDLTLGWLTDKESIVKEISKLYSESMDPPVFYSSGMIETFFTVSKQEIFLAVGYKDQKAVIALPLMKKSHWQNVSYSGWDNLDLIVAKNCTSTLTNQFWVHLINEIRLLKLSEWNENSTVSCQNNFFALNSVDRRKCPYISIPESWDELNANLGNKLVRNIRQYGNKAKKAGISFKILEASKIDTEQKLHYLEVAFGFHSKRMSTINQSSKFISEKIYHEEVMLKSSNVYFILGRNADEELIACYYGFLNNKRLAWFNGGVDSNYLKYSIGTLLVAEMISFAMTRKMEIFDFLRGNETYKQKWTFSFNRNKDVYISSKNPYWQAKMKTLVFNDLRSRIGGKKAIQLLLK